MDYQGNPDKKPDKDKKPEKNIEKVVTGEVIQKPTGIGRKFKTIFFGGDMKSSVRYVAADVLLPALRDILVDVITSGAKRMVYGESFYRRRPTEMRSRTSYNAIYSNPIDVRSRPMDPRDRARLPDQPHQGRQERFDPGSFVAARREDAERVIERMSDILDMYEVVSLADLLDLLGKISSPIDNKWGWTYLKNVEIRQVREGWLIELPELEAI
jgi:hypothetical protein